MNAMNGDGPALDVLRRRQAPCFAVLAEDMRIVSAEHRLASVCTSSGYAPPRNGRLPAVLEQTLCNMLAESPEGTAAICGSVLIRATILEGVEGRRIAVSLERLAHRAPLETAAERFALTPREATVLELILQGLCAKDIAVRLQIAQTTVGEYFKHLAVKTGTHGRAHMIARVLDYNGPLST